MSTYREGNLVRTLALARHGDEVALEEFLRLLYPPLRNFAGRHLRFEADGEDAAKDIAQEALLRITSHLDQCRASCDPQVLGWALQITRRLCVDYFRQKRTYPRTILLPNEEETTPNPLSTSPVPETAAELLSRLVSQLVPTLPLPAQDLVALRFHDGRTWDDVAAALGLSRSATKRRFQRFQQSFRKRILKEVGQLSPVDRECALRFLKLPQE